ncbi:PREDICTED: protein STRUBBELIG-RECEPTOR FAMILY 8 [Theobroma cacao]|uniref:non-specific serine/threonine protein kinase n=1 Tax=Theobroma cacao TaxID=3641 RepID=A0AB32X297_THECC|nr:PREDICTED: protein STRUBBELIG-RECEPTOR FAMILY 8 [Theobroma cacao]
MIDAAATLEYLHLGHPNPIIHCDLKPSNVLLDGDMVAHVGDFGIAKLLGEVESMKQTMTLATIGYMAPEYGSTGIVFVKSDVYSYGILLMETFTRRKPTDEIFVGEMSMKHWVKESLSNETIGVADSSLLRSEERHFMAKANCISSIMELALDCSVELPEKRKDMKDVTTRNLPQVVRMGIIIATLLGILDAINLKYSGCGSHLCTDIKDLKDSRKLGKNEYKSEAFEKFKEFKVTVKEQTGKSILTLRSDRGGEYLSQDFLDHLTEHGILSQWTPFGTPQHNGVSERRNQTLLDMVHSMMSRANLLISFWGYALETTAYLLNNSIVIFQDFRKCF